VGDKTTERGLTIAGAYDPGGIIEFELDLITVTVLADCGLCPDPDIPAVPGSVWTGSVVFESVRWKRERESAEDDWGEWSYSPSGFGACWGAFPVLEYDASIDDCYPDGCDGYFNVIATETLCDEITTVFPIRGLVHIQGLNLHCADQNLPP
jgi:hypothetical protein